MVTAIIQARMSSSRLPGKVMMNLCGKPSIAHIIERLQQCQKVDQMVLATSVDPSDDVLVDYMEKLDIPCFRGSLNHVLERFYYAACQYSSEYIVRICADSPLVDWEIIDSTVQYCQEKRADIVKTVNMPLGLGTEVFTFSALEQAYKQADQDYQREHVTPYVYENGISYNYLWRERPSQYRLTVDTPKDFEVIEQVYQSLYHGKHDFAYDAVTSFLDGHPEIVEINQNIEQIEVPLRIRKRKKI